MTPAITKNQVITSIAWSPQNELGMPAWPGAPIKKNAPLVMSPMNSIEADYKGWSVHWVRRAWRADNESWLRSFAQDTSRYALSQACSSEEPTARQADGGWHVGTPATATWYGHSWDNLTQAVGQYDWGNMVLGRNNQWPAWKQIVGQDLRGITSSLNRNRSGRPYCYHCWRNEAWYGSRICRATKYVTVSG